MAFAQYAELRIAPLESSVRRLLQPDSPRGCHVPADAAQREETEKGADMRRRTLCSVLALCVAGLAPLGAVSVRSAELASEPIRLTPSQMDKITAGTAVVATDASAFVLGQGSLALTSARTLAGGPHPQFAGGGSGAFGIGSLLIATSSTTTASAGDGESSAGVSVGANGGATGDSALASSQTRAMAVDGAAADLALGMARGVAVGSDASDVVVTSSVGGSGGRLITGSVSKVIRTPGFTLGVAWAFAISIDPSATTLPRNVALRGVN